MRTTLSMHHIARIEGHGNISLSIEDGRVSDVKMNVVEPARLFESMVGGRPFTQTSYIASRICGICSSSHVITDLLAIEQIFGVKTSERTRVLRELLVYGSFLQNHAAHLFVFAAPDFEGLDSAFPLAESAPELFNGGMAIKALGNELCTLVGGRSIHPITCVVGGFTHEPSRDDCLAMADKVAAAREFCEKTVDVFAGFHRLKPLAISWRSWKMAVIAWLAILRLSHPMAHVLPRPITPTILRNTPSIIRLRDFRAARARRKTSRRARLRALT